MIPSGCALECPGCKYRELDCESSNKRKLEWALRNLEPYAPLVQGVFSPSLRWGYRKKTLLHAKIENGKWQYGLLKRRGWEFNLIAIPNCPIHTPEVNEILRSLFSFLPLETPLAFVQVSGNILSLILKAKADTKWSNTLLEKQSDLKKAGVASLFINWNPSAGRRVFSSRHWQKVYGEEFAINEGLFYGPISFRQQISELENQVLQKSSDFFSSLNPQLVIDLYSGIGAGMRKWEMLGWKTVGVELNGNAVDASTRNLRKSQVLRGKVEDRIPQLNNLDLSNSVLFTNPPRGGHDPRVNEWIKAQDQIKGLIYLSCNVKTLGRDLEQLSSDFHVKSIEIFDFFPQTDHVEALVCLNRKFANDQLPNP